MLRLAFAEPQKLVPATRLRVMGLLDCLGHGVRSLHSLTPTLREGPGLVIKKGDSPIVPVMLLNAKLGQTIARDLFYEGIYVIGFFFPVVPAGQARIRTQMSADHEIPQLEQRRSSRSRRSGRSTGSSGSTRRGSSRSTGCRGRPLWRPDRPLWRPDRPLWRPDHPLWRPDRPLWRPA